jgi:micrococcal nuclease
MPTKNAGFDYANNRYKAAVIRWVDGDTVILRVDLGQKTSVEGSYRLNRLNVPETHNQPGTTEQTAQGLSVQAKVEAACPVGSSVWVQTSKADRYGRYLAELFFLASDGKVWTNLNDWMLASGLAKAYNGTGVKPV